MQGNTFSTTEVIRKVVTMHRKKYTKPIGKNNLISLFLEKFLN